MSSSALKTISSCKYLSLVWDDMYKKTPKAKRDFSAGIDALSVTYIENNKQEIFKDISDRIRSGTYKFSPLKPHFLPKPDGKERLICVPTVQDRLVQRALLKYLSGQRKYCMRNKVSFGFLPGSKVSETLIHAQHKRQSLSWVYKADISSFFDEIDRSILKEKIKRRIRLSSLHDLLCSVVDTEVYIANNNIKKRIKKLGIRNGKGIRQGMPLSPYFSNIFLEKFDLTIQEKEIRMIRYADDFLIFTDSEQRCRDHHSMCENLLSKIGLAIHPLTSGTKTTISSPNEAVEFLGLNIEKKGGG